MTVPTLGHRMSSNFLVQDTQDTAFLCNKSRLLFRYHLSKRCHDPLVLSGTHTEHIQAFSEKMVRLYSKFLMVKRGIQEDNDCYLASRSLECSPSGLVPSLLSSEPCSFLNSMTTVKQLFCPVYAENQMRDYLACRTISIAAFSSTTAS